MKTNVVEDDIARAIFAGMKFDTVAQYEAQVKHASGLIDNDRHRLIAALRKAEEEVARLRAYVGREMFCSDYRTAGDMRAALDHATTEWTTWQRIASDELERTNTMVGLRDDAIEERDQLRADLDEALAEEKLSSDALALCVKGKRKANDLLRALGREAKIEALRGE